MIKIAADLHGNVGVANHVLSQWEDAAANDYLIIAGDFGAEYDTYISSSFKKAFKAFPGTVIVMRGNHDSSYWKMHTSQVEEDSNIAHHPDYGWSIENDLLYQNKYPNIKYIKDEGGLYNIGGYNILFLPGAYSVDKDIRLARGLPYNPHEQLTYFEKKRLLTTVEKNDNINYIVSHACPRTILSSIQEYFLPMVDQSQVDDSTEKFLEIVCSEIGMENFDKWYFGHYHGDKTIGKFHMVYTTPVKLGE